MTAPTTAMYHTTEDGHRAKNGPRAKSAPYVTKIVPRIAGRTAAGIAGERTTVPREPRAAGGTAGSSAGVGVCDRTIAMTAPAVTTTMAVLFAAAGEARGAATAEMPERAAAAGYTNVDRRAGRGVEVDRGVGLRSPHRRLRTPDPGQADGVVALMTIPSGRHRGPRAAKGDPRTRSIKRHADEGKIPAQARGNP